MWDFLKRKPPAQPVHDCVENLNAWRRYVLEELDTYYQKILAELSVTDRESLSRLHELITEFNLIENRVDSALDLMKEQINTLENMLKNPLTVGYTIKPKFSPASGNLEFMIEVKKNA